MKRNGHRADRPWFERFRAAAAGQFSDEHRRPAWSQAAHYLADRGYVDAALELERVASCATDRAPGKRLTEPPEWLADEEWRDLLAEARRRLWTWRIVWAALEVEAETTEGMLAAALTRLGAPPERLAELLGAADLELGDMAEHRSMRRWLRAELVRRYLASAVSKLKT